MTERIALIRIERKPLAGLDIHADWLRDHPEDASPQIQALDGSLEQMLVTNDQETHDFHAGWIDALATEYAHRS